MEVLKKKPEKRFHSGFVVSTKLRVVALDHPVDDCGLVTRTPPLEMLLQLLVTLRQLESKRQITCWHRFVISLWGGILFIFLGLGLFRWWLDFRLIIGLLEIRVFVILVRIRIFFFAAALFTIPLCLFSDFFFFINIRPIVLWCFAGVVMNSIFFRNDL